MNVELRSKIINLLLVVFNDIEFNYVLSLLEKKSYNELRLICSNKVEYLNVISEFDYNNNILDMQLQYIDELEDIFTDLYIENLTEDVLITGNNN